jgi:hypothetical protein
MNTQAVAPTTSFSEQADADLIAVQDDPAQRLEFARSFFVRHPSEGITNFGRSELAFMQWEVRRGCLNSRDDPARPGSVWWRCVNGSLLRDAQEAHLLYDAGHDMTSGLASNAAVVQWQLFLEQPSARHWYLAHNSSIAAGYVRFVAEAAGERGHEQKLMNLVLYRVLFTQAIVDDQRWTLGWFSSRLSRWVTPASTMVTRVVHRRDLYPSSYPLNDQDCERLDRRLNHLGDLAVSLIDLIVIGGRLPWLYEYAATTLGIEELRLLARRHMACYPWGLRLDVNELEAIASNDRPTWLVRILSRAVDGFAR